MLSKPLIPGGAHSIDLLNASKNPYGACSSVMEKEMVIPFPYPRGGRPAAEEYCTFLSTITEKVKEELKTSTKVKIESVGLRSLIGDIPRYHAELAECGDSNGGEPRQYEDGAEYFQDLFNDEETDLDGGIGGGVSS